MEYLDLRDWLERTRALGEVRDVAGASWQEVVRPAADVQPHPVEHLPVNAGVTRQQARIVGRDLAQREVEVELLQGIEQAVTFC